MSLLFVLLTLYLVVEVIGGLLSGSLALLADAGHMAIDAAAVALGLFAIWVASKPPNVKKTYGYYRAEILAALLNGTALIAVSLWIFYEAWRRLATPPEIEGQLMSAVAAGGLLVNAVGLFLIHKDSHSSLNMRGVWLHLLSDTLGSVSALAAGIMVWKFNWTLADPVISIGIGMLILLGAGQLVMECVNVLLEAVPKGIDVAQIKQRIESIEEVKDVHDLHVWTLTSGVPALSAHIRIQEDTDSGLLLDRLTGIMKEEFQIEHVTLQLEPPAFVHDELHV